MSRPKKATPPPDKMDKKAGPAAPDPGLVSTLDSRAAALAQAQKARKRMAFDAPLPLYERIISQAERWDEPLNVVMRAAIEAGLDRLRDFPGDPRRSPYSQGAPAPRTPSQFDPIGNQFPPPPVQPWRPAPTAPTETYNETVWAPPESPAFPPGILPSGATVDYRAPAPTEMPPPPPLPPQPVFGALGDWPEKTQEAIKNYLDEPVQQGFDTTAFRDPFADDDAKVKAAIAEVMGAPADDSIADLL